MLEPQAEVELVHAVLAPVECLFNIPVHGAFLERKKEVELVLTIASI